MIANSTPLIYLAKILQEMGIDLGEMEAISLAVEMKQKEYRLLLESLIKVGFRMSEELYLNALKMGEQIKKS